MSAVVVAGRLHTITRHDALDGHCRATRSA
ncbi:hypothetical protein DC74_692 [Streptomyces noursei]|nr:hypothetical protein DC74_692 [Streptomyces noursei]